jgi:hypothetical protein
MTDQDPTDPNSADELDEAVEAAEQHQRAEENPDAEEDVVIRDPQTGQTTEERVQ